VKRILSCPASIPHYQTDGMLVFDHAAVSSDGYSYLFFTFLNVTDLMLVYRMEQNGRLTSVFPYSLLRDFMVPE